MTPGARDCGAAAAINADDPTQARYHARALTSDMEKGADLSAPVAFALGLYQLNIEPDAPAAMKWFARAAETSTGDQRLEAELHLALAAQRLPAAQRDRALPDLVAQLEKAQPVDPHLGSRIKDLAASYSQQAGTREAAK